MKIKIIKFLAILSLLTFCYHWIISGNTHDMMGWGLLTLGYAAVLLK